MYIKLAAEHSEALKAAGVEHKAYDNTLYVSLKDFKAGYERLSDKIDVGAAVRFESLVFGADYAVVREVD